MITNLIKKRLNGFESVEIVENQVMFQEGMQVAFTGDFLPSIVENVVLTVTKPSLDATVGSIVQNVFLKDVKENQKPKI